MESYRPLASAAHNTTLVLLAPLMFSSTGSTDKVLDMANLLATGCPDQRCKLLDKAFGTFSICEQCTLGRRKGGAERNKMLKDLKDRSYHGTVVPVPCGPLDNLAYYTLPSTQQTLTQAAVLTLLNMDRTREHEQRVRSTMEQMFPQTPLPSNLPDLLHVAQEALRRHAGTLLQLEEQLVVAFMKPPPEAMQSATNMLQSPVLHQPSSPAPPEENTILFSGYPQITFDDPEIYHVIIHSMPEELVKNQGQIIYNLLQAIQLTQVFEQQKGSLARQSVDETLRNAASLPPSARSLVHLCIQHSGPTGIAETINLLKSLVRIHLLAAGFNVHVNVVRYT